MKKQIIITEDENNVISFSIAGFSPMEVLGMLRFQEKRVWLEIIKAQESIESKPEVTCKKEDK